MLKQIFVWHVRKNLDRKKWMQILGLPIVEISSKDNEIVVTLKKSQSSYTVRLERLYYNVNF